MSSFDRVAHCYDETRAIPPAASAAVVARIVAELRRRTGSAFVLEVGIGTGRIAVPLAESGLRMVGVDIAPAMLARLRARRPSLPVLRASGESLPFGAGTFDAVLFVHVLHLLPDAAVALRAARGVTRPGGVLMYGREDFAAAPLQPILGMVRDLAGQLAGVAIDPRSPGERAAGAFAASVHEMGVEAQEIVVARWPVRLIGRRLLADIAGKVWSSTWAIPDSVMPELIRRLTPRVESLLGDLDRVSVHEVTFALTIAPCP